MVSGEWAILGDFNSTLATHYRIGSVMAHYHRDSDRFTDAIQDYDLMDASF